jgi:hypothetical protein
MNLTDLLTPTYRNMLQTLKSLLDKAEALLSARLAPDMFPLATQIRFAAVQAFDGPRRLLGKAHPAEVEDILNEGRNAGDKPGTLAEAKARIDQALAYVDSLAADALDEVAEDEPLVLDLPMGMTFDLTRAQFARDWALGQFYFHIMAAYAILRKEGVEIGKGRLRAAHVSVSSGQLSGLVIFGLRLVLNVLKGLAKRRYLVGLERNVVRIPRTKVWCSGFPVPFNRRSVALFPSALLEYFQE